MALPSAFHERLEQMEQARNQRLSLLKAERDLQVARSQVFATKLSTIRTMEQRCLKLDQKIASRQFMISSLKSEIDSLDSKYEDNLRQIRGLKSEVEELQELAKEKEVLYGIKMREMEDFAAQVGNFAVDCQMQVQELRSKVNELKSIFLELQGNNGHLNNSEIAAAEVRKSELLDAKENLDRSLASNYQIRAQLQKQLHSILSEEKKQREMLARPVSVKD